MTSPEPSSAGQPELPAARASANSTAQVVRTGRRRRPVAARILLSYATILFVFVVAAGWSLWAQRSSAREAALMRDGYLPLSLSLRDLVANQDTWNTQLNHITTARNPADKRVWFETAISIGRPKKLAEVRADIERAFEAGDEHTRAIGEELRAEVSRIERFLAEDEPLVSRLFDRLAQKDEIRAQELRDELVTRGSRAKRRLSELERRVEDNVDALLDQARDRERLALGLLGALVVLTLLVGILMALYARRVLMPLSVVTARAEAVADGDLTPREVLRSDDELGELSATFEGMVEAIARANTRLLASERLATIGKMAAHVTHEVRNPLSSIALNLELLEEELSDEDQESRALVRAISREVERLSALSGQYLSMTRRQHLELGKKNAGDLVEEACDFMRGDLSRHGVELDVHVQDGPLDVHLDESQLKQALFNLIRNAREAMPDGGAIGVLVRPHQEGIEVRVQDEGPGIDPLAAESLFDPFFTTKRHGTGLGLAVTKQVVAGHGGRIWYEARSPRGSCFCIVLPKTPPAVGLEEEFESTHADTSSPKRTPPDAPAGYSPAS